MTYITGTITDANPGPALHTLMATALTTAGFILVDTVVISTRTHKVWKSPAASNVANLDWFLDIAYTTTGAGTFTTMVMEYFDPATDLAYRAPVTSATTWTIDPTTGTRYGATGFSLESVSWTMNASIVSDQVAISTSAMTYFFSATVDRVIVLFSTAPTDLRYAGLYEPDPLYAAKVGGAIYPLVCGKPDGSTAGDNLGISRATPWTGTTISGGNMVATSYPTLTYPVMPTGSTVMYPYVALRIDLMSNYAAGYTGRWGWFRDMVYIPSSGVGRGDTCTIAGNTYVLSGTVGNKSFGFRPL